MKIMGILVCMLLIGVPILSATTVNHNIMSSLPSYENSNHLGITDKNPALKTTSSKPFQEEFTITGNKRQSISMEFWDIILQIEITQSLYTAGVGADHLYIYAPEWSGSNIYYWDFEGEYQGSFTISGAANIRDLAYDHKTGYMWGGNGGGTCWEMDFESHEVINTITGSWQCRAIAYDETEDQFFISGWSDPVWIIKRDGSVIEQFNLALTTSTYGFAYDKWDTEYAPILWVHDQGGTGSEIRAYDLSEEEFIEDELYYHDVTQEVPGGIAGGLCYNEWFSIEHCALIVNCQSTTDTIVCYEWTLYPCVERDVSVIKIDEPSSGYVAVSTCVACL